MMAKTHAVFGAASVAAAADVFGFPCPAWSMPLFMLVGAAASLLPDIDHPKSTLGRALPWLSVPIAGIFGHRGFTHSLLAIIGCLAGICYLLQASPETGRDWFFQSTYLAVVLGYLSHLLADWMSASGIPLTWPFERRSSGHPRCSLWGWTGPFRSFGRVNGPFERGCCCCAALAATVLSADFFAAAYLHRSLSMVLS